MDDVVSGLVAELAQRRYEILGQFDTIYIGGGTPSVLPLELLHRLVGSLPVSEADEFTIEVNPDDVNGRLVMELCDMGVNRVSMGVQALDDEVLRAIGRRHTAAKALAAVDELRSGGITNISCDLIYGLPGQSSGQWEHGLRRLLSTGITHLSAYCLTYYEGTPLWRMVQAGRVIPDDDDTLAARFASLRSIAADAGFEHYEISNFALPGFRSRHNSAYWAYDGSWIGIGPSAYSFDGAVRRYNPSDIDEWMAALPNPAIVEHESRMDIINDHIVTALRTIEGLDLSCLPDECSQGILRDSAQFVRRGDMTLVGNRLAINPDRWLLADAYIREMIRD